MPIQRILCNPPIAIARFGKSSVPLDAFEWAATDDPRSTSTTQIQPAWTLDVRADGRVEPRMPTEIRLEDAGRLRPVAPFIELWADVGDTANESTWTRVPLTPALLQEEGLNVANLFFEVEAMNFKAARRANQTDLRFGTFPAVTIRGDDHADHALEATSPPGATSPMIPAGRSIPMGRVRVIRSSVQPEDAPWSDELRLDTIRLRMTPPPGEFYGPTNVAGLVAREIDNVEYPVVPVANAFLNGNAGWLGIDATSGWVAPGDTYAGAEQPSSVSLGVVDDSSEIRIRVRLDATPVGGEVLRCHANLFSGPPHYAPDRRPFLSAADEFNDRSSDIAARDAELDDAALDRWVEDLFERAYETAGLMNVDFYRGVRGAALLATDLTAGIQGDGTPDPTRAMGGQDALRDPNIAIPAPSANVPLPLSDRARERHRNLSDIVALKAFVRQQPARLGELMRPPFRRSSVESPSATTMQMPPFMRNSNAQPLTLAQWQYDLLFAWQTRVLAGPPTVEEEERATGMSPSAARRRRLVLDRLDAEGQ